MTTSGLAGSAPLSQIKVSQDNKIHVQSVLMHVSSVFCAAVQQSGLAYKTGANTGPTQRSTKHFKAEEDWQIQQDG